MFDQIRRLIKDSGIYGLGVVSSKAIGFLLVPVYTRYLQPSEYGTLELLDLIIFFATIFAALGINSAVFRFYSSAESADDKKEVVSTALIAYSSLSLLVSTIIFLLAPIISTAIFGTSTLSTLVRISSATLFFSNLTEVPMMYFRASGKIAVFVYLGLARTLLNSTFMLIALMGLHKGILGILWANFAANAIAGTFLALYVISKVPKGLSIRKLTLMLRYGLPLIFHHLAGFALVFSDRFFLRYFGNLSEVGVYSLGYKLAAMVTVLVSGPFSMSWTVQQFEMAKREDGPEMYAKVQFYQLLASVSVGVAISVFSRDLLRIMVPSSYWPAANVVPLIVLTYVIDSMRTVVVSGVFVKDDTNSLATSAIAVGLANLLLNVIFIPRYLAMGAAVATVLSYAFRLGINFYSAQRVYRVPYYYRLNLAALGSAAAVCIASSLHQLPISLSIAVNSVLLSIFGAICVFLLSPKERLAAYRFARSAFTRTNLSSAAL